MLNHIAAIITAYACVDFFQRAQVLWGDCRYIPLLPGCSAEQVTPNRLKPRMLWSNPCQPHTARPGPVAAGPSSSGTWFPGICWNEAPKPFHKPCQTVFRGWLGAVSAPEDAGQCFGLFHFYQFCLKARLPHPTWMWLFPPPSFSLLTFAFVLCLQSFPFRCRLYSKWGVQWEGSRGQDSRSGDRWQVPQSPSEWSVTLLVLHFKSSNDEVPTG